MSGKTTERATHHSRAGVLGLAIAWYVVSCLNSGLFQATPVAAQQAAEDEKAAAAPEAKPPRDFLGDLKNLKDGAPKLGQGDDLEKILARRGTMQVRQATLDEWMLTIMRVWNVDIRYDPAALREVTYAGQFSDRTLQEVLDTMLYDLGFGYRKVANGLSIMRQSELSKFTNQQTFDVIPMEYSNPAEIAPTLTFLLTPKGTAQPLASSKALAVMDLPENVDLVRKYVERLEALGRESHERQLEEERKRRELEMQAQRDANPATPGGDVAVQPVEQTKYTVFPIQYMKADALMEAVGAQFGAEVMVSTVEGENKIVVSGPESSLLSVAQLIRAIDTPRKQVRVSIKMYDVSVEALEQLGVNWRQAGKGRLDGNGVPNTLGDFNSSPLQLGSSGTSTTTTGTSGTSSGSSSSTTAGSTSGYPSVSTFLTSASPPLLGSALNLYHISRYFDVNAVILALDQNTGARLLATPTVRVDDRTEAEIKIITEIPVQQLTQTSDGGQIGTTTFREAGTTLKVTPEIRNDGTVKLTVAPEFSLLRGFNGVQPIIDRRTAKTEVSVLSGETFVLAGLRRRNENEVVSGVPGLMNIKYLGSIFRAHRTTVTESELLIFIQTEIIDVNYPGHVREQVAAQVIDETMDHIPYASHAPFIPPCNDPYCPLHNPRPRVWQGSVLSPSAPYPHDPAHGPVHEPLSGPVNGPQFHPGETSPRPVPNRPAPPSAPVETLKPQADSPSDTPAATGFPNSPVNPAPTPRKPSEGATPATIQPPNADQGPPPVIIDETARRRNAQYLTTSRLPKTTEETANPGLRPPASAARQNGPPPTAPRVASEPKSWWSDLFR